MLARVEVLAGVRPPQEVATRRLLDALEWWPVDVEIADRAGALANRFMRSHPGVDPVDYVIAATAEALGASLWTKNVKHSPMIEGPQAPY